MKNDIEIGFPKPNSQPLTGLASNFHYKFFRHPLSQSGRVLPIINPCRPMLSESAVRVLKSAENSLLGPALLLVTHNTTVNRQGTISGPSFLRHSRKSAVRTSSVLSGMSKKYLPNPTVRSRMSANVVTNFKRKDHSENLVWT